MTSDQDAMAGAWQDAAADLGLKLRTPFSLSEGNECIAWVADFGSPQGTVVVGLHSSNEAVRAIAKSRSMYCSEVDEEAYSKYDRELFVETLNDWGWFGDPSGLPEWYTGHQSG